MNCSNRRGNARREALLEGYVACRVLGVIDLGGRCRLEYLVYALEDNVVNRALCAGYGREGERADSSRIIICRVAHTRYRYTFAAPVNLNDTARVEVIEGQLCRLFCGEDGYSSGFSSRLGKLVEAYSLAVAYRIVGNNAFSVGVKKVKSVLGCLSRGIKLINKPCYGVNLGADVKRNGNRAARGDCGSLVTKLRAADKSDTLFESRVKGVGNSVLLGSRRLCKGLDNFFYLNIIKRHSTHTARKRRNFCLTEAVVFYIARYCRAHCREHSVYIDKRGALCVVVFHAKLEFLADRHRDTVKRSASRAASRLLCGDKLHFALGVDRENNTRHITRLGLIVVER